MGSVLYDLRVFITLFRNLPQYRQVFVNVIFAIGFTGFQGKRFGDNPGMMRHPVMLEAKIYHTALHVLGPEAGVGF
jgi:hypothetical protein